jgi:hypothetical protein
VVLGGWCLGTEEKLFCTDEHQTCNKCAYDIFYVCVLATVIPGGRLFYHDYHEHAFQYVEEHTASRVKLVQIDIEEDSGNCCNQKPTEATSGRPVLRRFGSTPPPPHPG